MLSKKIVTIIQTIESLVLPPGVNFNKKNLPNEKMLAHRVWQKNHHSISPIVKTPYFKLFCQICLLVAKHCVPKSLSS